jgi:hypothetical protein
VSARSFSPPTEPAQIDYETLRAHLVETDQLPDDLAAARFVTMDGGQRRSSALARPKVP